MRWLGSRISSLVAWLNRLPLPAKGGLAVLAVGVVFMGSFGALRTYDYTQNDPQFCRSCHTMTKAWDRWNTSEHKTIDCHKCHEQSIAASMEQLAFYALERPNDVSKHAEVRNDVCERCHESGNPRWLQVASTAGHTVHAEQQRVDCVTCHSTSLHRFAPPQEICAQCHPQQIIKVSGMAAQHCTTCHNYLRQTDQQLLPEREDCLRCHQTPAEKAAAALPAQQRVTWPEVAPMKWDCSQCHKPHEQDRPIVDCKSCHGVASGNGKHTVSTHAQAACKTCHQPHAWKVTSRDTCLSCHANKAEHNPGVTCFTCHSFKK